MGNLLNLRFNEEEAVILEKKFELFQDELIAKIRLLKVN